MVQFKLVISDPKTGKTVQREASEDDSSRLNGMKIGDIVKGETIGLTGYEFEITGGSDYCGFPMRRDITGIRRKKILIVKGIGLNKTAKGMKKRKTVAGNTIHPKTAQINLKIVKAGKENLFESKKEGEVEATSAEEAKPAEAPKAEEKPKEEVKPKEKAEEKKEEAPKEKKKEEKTKEKKE